MLEKLKEAGRLEWAVIAGVAIAGAAVANVPGRYDAAVNWRSYISSELDKAGNQEMQALKTESAKDWIADDQKAFVRAVDKFISELETCRKYAESVGGTVEKVAQAYTKYWTSLGAGRPRPAGGLQDDPRAHWDHRADRLGGGRRRDRGLHHQHDPGPDDLH